MVRDIPGKGQECSGARGNPRKDSVVVLRDFLDTAWIQSPSGQPVMLVLDEWRLGEHRFCPDVYNVRFCGYQQGQQADHYRTPKLA